MIKLTLTEKGGQPRALTFDQAEVSIGRVQGNDIVLPKGNISKRHSKLSLVDGRITVSDSKSTNGTYVNGRKISEPTSVRAGDKIFVGDFLIVIDPITSAEVLSTGSRRGAPPPPPPPRPGMAMRSGLDGSEEIDTLGGLGLGDHGDKMPALGRGRPPAPPPPPPRRTMVTSALEDDSVDMGPDDAPPSPAEVGADAGVGASDGLANDVEEDALAGTGDDIANVFGSRPASDEDAGHEPGLGSDGEPERAAASDGAGEVDRLAPTPAPAAAAHALAHEPGPAPISLDTLLADASITAIVIGAGASAEVERGGKLESIGSIGDGNLVAEAVWQLANTAVPPPAADNPIVDVRLLDGTRVTALFPPVTPASVCAVIRRPTVVEVSLADIAGNGDVEKIIGGAVSSRRNLLVAGDAPALAAMASALGSAFGADHHVVSIGAGARTRPHWTDLGATGDPASLVRAAVAFRADHLLVAEAGGGELPELLLAAAKGQNGVVASIAARSASEALERLRAFSIGAIGPQAFAPLVASTIDLVVLVESSPAGGARIVEIAEPVNDASGLHLAQVARRPETDRASGNLEIAGVSERLAGAIAAHAEGLPSHLVRR